MVLQVVRRVTLIAIATGILCCVPYVLARWQDGNTATDAANRNNRSAAGFHPLPPLDAHGFTGVKEMPRSELVSLITDARALAPDEMAQLHRGCPGLACLYQGLGLKRWPESARGTRAYLRREDALNRRCPDGEENFIFVKQAWWATSKPPTPDPATGEVPLASVTRAKPGRYTFNYAVYFPTTRTYAWMNNREHGFPLNLIKPQKAYLSAAPPPLTDTRDAQIYCSTCR